MDCRSIRVGGCSDHIHIIRTLSKKLPLMKLPEEVRSTSSKWMKTKDRAFQNFYGQDGYGAFSVNPSEIDGVIDYIARQRDHHRKLTFKEEYPQML